MYNECVDKIVSAVFFIIIIIITTIGVNTAMNSDCKKKKMLPGHKTRSIW